MLKNEDPSLRIIDLCKNRMIQFLTNWKENLEIPSRSSADFCNINQKEEFGGENMKLSSKIIGWIWLWLALLFPSTLLSNGSDGAFYCLPFYLLITIPLYIISVSFISEFRWARWWLMSISLIILFLVIYGITASTIAGGISLSDLVDPSNIINILLIVFVFIASLFLFLDRPKKIWFKHKKVKKIPGNLSVKAARIWIVGSIIITTISIINIVVSKENDVLSIITSFLILAILLVIPYVFAIFLFKRNRTGWWGFIISSYLNINVSGSGIYGIQSFGGEYNISDLLNILLPLAMLLLSISTLILLLIDNPKGWEIVPSKEDLDEREKI